MKKIHYGFYFSEFYRISSEHLTSDCGSKQIPEMYLNDVVTSESLCSNLCRHTQVESPREIVMLSNSWNSFPDLAVISVTKRTIYHHKCVEQTPYF